jgi:hypothetical protein
VSRWRHLIRRYDGDVKIVRIPEGIPLLGEAVVLLGRSDAFVLPLSTSWSLRATSSGLPCARITAGNWTTLKDDEICRSTDWRGEEDLIARGGRN